MEGSKSLNYFSIWFCKKADFFLVKVFLTENTYYTMHTNLPQVSTRTNCSSILLTAASAFTTTSSPVSGCVMMQFVELRRPRIRNLGSDALWMQIKRKISGKQCYNTSFYLGKGKRPSVLNKGKSVSQDVLQGYWQPQIAFKRIQTQQM